MRDMTCQEFDEAVHGFVRMELLDVELREALVEHASRCSPCAERMADATALAEALESAGQRVRTEQAPPSVEIALLAIFRNHHRRAAWRRTFEWATVGAAAAALMFFVWTAGWRWRAPSSPAPRKGVSSQSNQPIEVNAGGHTAPIAAGEASPQATAGNATVSANDAYAASDFVPVPFTGGITSDDPGMIVRVQLTRASLAQLGYPVAEAPDEDLIRADVLVGEDGWPRGVKLIQ